MNKDYIQGQLDLIAEIKKQVRELENKTTIKDLPFDIIHLLKNIKPVTNGLS